MVKAYNFCDGKNNITDIAEKVKVSKRGLSGSIRRWEELGIVFNYGGHGMGTDVLPVKLYTVNQKPIAVVKNKKNLVR